MSSTQLIPQTIRFRPLPAPLESATSDLAPIHSIVKANNMNPCRRCLRDAKIGDKVTLLSYDAWLGDSPYRQSGPIFVHADDSCALADLSGEGALVPEQHRRRFLSVRAMDEKNMMVGFDTLEGVDLVDRAEKFFEEQRDVEYLHVHYAGPGCFAVRIDRGVAK